MNFLVTVVMVVSFSTVAKAQLNVCSTGKVYDSVSQSCVPIKPIRSVPMPVTSAGLNKLNDGISNAEDAEKLRQTLKDMYEGHKLSAAEKKIVSDLLLKLNKKYPPTPVSKDPQQAPAK